MTNKIQFRDLRADEIEVRVATVGENGVRLLLYKNARCDMNILDETVGAENWQRDHKELKGNIYCAIGIYDDDKATWIWKWDCGAESYTEKEKGEASDSFKRAGFNWGIGRELYTSPFIWVTDCKREQNGNKWTCKDRFKVRRIEIKDKTITKLEIINNKNKIVYSFGYEVVETKREFEPVICPECGIQILKTTTPKGRIWTPKEILEKYGMCGDCYKKSKLTVDND